MNRTGGMFASVKQRHPSWCLWLLAKCVLFMSDVAGTPYLTYKTLYIQYIAEPAQAR